MFKTYYATESTTDILKPWRLTHQSRQWVEPDGAAHVGCHYSVCALARGSQTPCHNMITLLKASQLLDLLVTQPEKPLDPDLKDAISMGAQGLRHIDYHRKAGHFFAQKLLPIEISGNTKGDYWKG